MLLYKGRAEICLILMDGFHVISLTSRVNLRSWGVLTLILLFSYVAALNFQRFVILI